MAKGNTPNPVGRPTVMTPEILEKLRTAYLIGCNDKEAYAYAQIPSSTFYKYQEEHPEFVEKKEEWKENPILRAKATLSKNLDQIETAKWYLERKKKDEFSSRNELTGKDGEKLEAQPVLVKFIGLPTDGNDNRDTN